MAEVKTEPVTTQHIQAWDEFQDGGRPRAGKIAGAVHIVDDGDKDRVGMSELTLWYCCPCGCGNIAPIIVGNGFKPADSPSWKWNGSLEKPTLTPSVHHRGHWHGWLTDGVWRSC